jgi:hypothetical protein
VFYLNFKGLILGKLIPSKDASSYLPHNYFLATHLLPCNKLDRAIKKFTGNDEIGDAPENMMKAIHTFAHFSHVYSDGYILPCDLQGKFTQSNHKITQLIPIHGN